MSEVNKELLALMGEFPEDKFDLLKFIQTAKERGIHVDYSALRMLSRSYPKLAEYLFPEIILDFIVALLKDFHPRKIYDPWATTGSLLSVLVESFKPNEGAIGIIQDEFNHEIAEYLTKSQNITWQLADPQEEIVHLEDFIFNPEDFIKTRNILCDFIVCAPQFGVKNKWTFDDEKWMFDDDKEWEKEEYEDSILEMHNAYEEYDDFISDAIQVLGVSSVLGDLNIGVFIVSSYFFNIIKEDDPTLENLNKKLYDLRKSTRNRLECYVDAAFQLPHEILDPFTSVPLYLILVRTGKATQENYKMFAGQLSGDERQDVLLLQNYRQHRAGRIPQQGVLIEENEFKGLDALINEYEIIRYRTKLVADLW